MLLKIDPFYFDEMFSFQFSQKPWLNSLHYWLLETNPPLHLLIEKLWFYIFPANELFARLISLIFGLLTIYLIYKLVSDIFNRQTALIASLLLALMPYHIFISIINRGYALLLFLSVLSYFFFHQVFIKNNHSTKNKALLAVVNFLLLSTHLTAIIFGISQLLIVILHNKKKIWSWFRINGLPIIIWSIWIIISVSNKMKIDIVYGAWFFNLGKNFYFFTLSLQQFFGSLNSIPLLLIILISTFIIIGKTIFSLIKTKKIIKEFSYLLFPAFLPIAVALLLKLWNIKFFLIALPFFIIILSYSINYWLNKKYGKLSLLIIVFLAYSAYNLLTFININDNWLRLNKLSNEFYNPTKKQVLLYDNFIYRDLFNRYYNSPLKSKPYFNHNQKYDEAVIRYNYILTPEDKQKLENWFLKNNIQNYDEVVWLNFPRRGIDFSPIFKKYNFKLKSYKKSILNDGTLLLVYEK